MLPIICPQPPHLCSDPSEFRRSALLPVPAIRTIPPVYRIYNFNPICLYRIDKNNLTTSL